MNYSLKNIRPDSFSGLIFGLEGLNGGRVILNGPTGCKFYHSATVDGQTMKSLSFDPLEYPELFYFGQGRVPCTYLDSHDYVFGAGEKIEKLLLDVKERNADFVALINSLGAALIGDDLNEFLRETKPVPIYFSIDNPGYSASYGDGVQRGLIALLEQLDIEEIKSADNVVNLLGFNIYQKYTVGNINELKRLLELCGIEVNCTFVDESVKDIKKIRKAKYNIVVYPEYGLEIAKYLESEYGMDYIVPSAGAPIGFKATESFLRDITSHMGTYSNVLEDELNRAKVRAYTYLARYTSLLGIPKGATYAIIGESSVAVPLLEFATDYLGMIPTGVQLVQEPYGDYLEIIKDREARTKDLLEESFDGVPYQILFGDGASIAASVGRDEYLCGIEILEPSMGYLDVVEKTILGVRGTLFLLEQVLNGLKFS